ncbi:M56 family metallopeptidase [Clostridium uliginosum]|uniref:Exopolysaccharide biosynthesis protein n=1 Tax=Clostridium uliginosum TaxID=119641 RepID=A0A1I1LS96_9CLOT|nr:M56 family metallopeptidase [Clostridium uliginosum]SFC76107.1 Exopolysaccharide biosynthesis protein [Clostridium uliginosum]
MIEIVIVNILRTTLISSIGICLLLILKKTLFKQYTKNFNYYIWLIVIFRMILPFKVPIYISTNSVISNDVGINNIESVSKPWSNIESINHSLNNNQVIGSAKQFTTFSMLEILGYLWLIVALIIVTYRICTYIKFKNTIIDLSCNAKDTKIKTIYNSLLIEMKINKRIFLKVSDYTSVPLGIGFFKSYIVLPNIEYKEKEVEWILKHELMHYKKNDILYKFLVMAVTSIYWFNPLIYVMNRDINIECELACDERILHNCDFKERQNYALTLINSLKHKESNFIETNLATKLGNKKILKRRFDSMFNKKTKKGMLIGVVCIVITTCSLGVISNKSGSNVLGEQEAQASTEKKDDSIELYELENSKYKGYYLEIKDPTRVKIGYTSKLMREGETTSQIAENNNAIAAINGGGFNDVSSDGTRREGDGGTPTGSIITGGKIVYKDLKDDEKTDLFAITKEGKLIVGKYSLNEISALGAEESLSFGPSLIINGEMTPLQGDGGWGIAPRTAIGQKKDGTIIMIVIDGRSLKSIGATIKELQEVMFKLGAVNAINLDGGKSTAMYYDGEIINKPSDGNKERAIATAIIVK